MLIGVAVDRTTRLEREVAPPASLPAKVQAGRPPAEAPTLPGESVLLVRVLAWPLMLAIPAKVRAGRPTAEAPAWRGETSEGKGVSSNARVDIWRSRRQRSVKCARGP